MADLASVGELIERGVEVLKISLDYINDVNHAPDEVSEIRKKVAAWMVHLESLETLSRSGRLSEFAMRYLQQQDFLLRSETCMADLTNLLQHAPRSTSEVRETNSVVRNLSNMARRLQWPVKTKERANQLLDQIDRLGDELQRFLAVENTTKLGNIEELIQQQGDTQAREMRQRDESKASDKDRRLVLAWLEPQFEPRSTEPLALHLARSKLQEPDTCNWMTSKCSEWQDWLNGGSRLSGGGRRFLWIHGLPGSGKTILASFLNDRLSEYCGAQGNAYYYCIHEHNQDETEFFLRHVIGEFCSQLRWIPSELQEMWRFKRMPIDGLVQCLLKVTLEFKDRFFKRAYIVVDAVDESHKPRKTFLQVLTHIGSDPKFDHVSLLMTSRYEPDIREAIHALPRVSLPLDDDSTSGLAIRVQAPKHQAFSFEQTQASRRRPDQLGEGFDVYSQPASPPSQMTTARGLSMRKQRRALSGAAGISSQTSRYPTAPPASHIQREASYCGSESSFHHDDAFESDSAPSQDRKYNQRPRGSRRSNALAKRNLSSGQQRSSSQRRQVSESGRYVTENEELVSPCTQYPMDNIFVREAIENVIDKRLRESDQFAQWPRNDFISQLKKRISARASGIFRAVACYLDLIVRENVIDVDDEAILKAIDRMPTTTFSQYEKILTTGMPGDALNHNSRHFARTALALITSETADLPDANVLVEASRFHVPQYQAQHYTLERLKGLLGCLVREEPLKKKRPSKFPRDSDRASSGDSLRLTMAHYTVREFLYSKDTPKTSAGFFALSNEENRKLELKIVFYGVQHCVAERKIPTRYEEYCLEMTESALKKRSALIVRDREIWNAVHPCLGWNDAHQTVLNKTARNKKVFPLWGRLANAFVSGNAPQHRHTCVLVSLLILEWPKLADVYLKDALTPEQREEIWDDRFALAGEPGANKKKAWDSATTVLEMCVMARRIDFLDVFVAAGATFETAGNIIYRVFERPYTDPDGDNDDGTTTLTLLRTLLQRGAEPNADGRDWTPLQFATRLLEPEWVNQLLFHGAHPNDTGEPSAEEDEDEDEIPWRNRRPIQICKDTIPKWADDNDEESTMWERDRVRRFLTNALIRDGIDVKRATKERVVSSGTVVVIDSSDSDSDSGPEL